MLLFVVDSETTGLDPKEHETTEIAAAVFDTISNSVLAFHSCLFPTENVSKKIEELTTISSELTMRCPIDNSIAALQEMYDKCEYAVAHNASFDMGFVSKKMDLKDKVWVCSYKELKWKHKAQRLTYMCADHEVPIFGAHRAINDVMMLCGLLRKCENLENQIIELKTMEKFTVQALVSFDDRHLAKEAGFRWDANKRLWLKEVRANSYEEVEKMFEFKVALCT
jgi:DNA polymerase-3 subunit epsilon